jgi:HemK-like putative methylase
VRSTPTNERGVPPHIRGRARRSSGHESCVEEVTFGGLSLLSAPGRVMTPRQASERVVSEACARLAGRRARVADVGTGGAAVAIAIARTCPRVEVWATDISLCAVALARANVRRHGLEERVFVRRCDLLDAVPAPVDLIVANLPYVPASAAPQHSDLLTEPWNAVFAAGDGLDPYRRLVDAAGTWLADDGYVLLQLYRRVVVASDTELRALRDAFDAPSSSENENVLSPATRRALAELAA